MRRNAFLGAAVISVLVSVAVAGQAPPQKPTPEHKKLGHFVGKWTTVGDVKPSPFGPGGKASSTDTCEWFQGGFAVLCHYEGKAPTGPTKGLGIIGYSADQKVYTYYGLDNSPMIMTTVSRGTVQGDTWTFTDESMIGGKNIKSRYVIKVASPTAHSFSWQTQGADGKWTSIMEGRSTKAS